MDRGSFDRANFDRLSFEHSGGKASSVGDWLAEARRRSRSRSRSSSSQQQNRMRTSSSGSSFSLGKSVGDDGRLSSSGRMSGGVLSSSLDRMDRMGSFGSSVGSSTSRSNKELRGRTYSNCGTPDYIAPEVCP
jgi:hypothetical protein